MEAKIIGKNKDGMKLTEKDYDAWWKNLTIGQKAETYWKMGDCFEG